jgi:flagellar FliL protein
MAKEEQAPAEAEAEGGGKKKMIIIIGAAVAVALVLGVVAFMMLGKGDKKTKKEGEAAPPRALLPVVTELRPSPVVTVHLPQPGQPPLPIYLHWSLHRKHLRRSGVALPQGKG